MRVENSTERMRDISSWQEGDISSLRSRAKKRYNKCKSALIEYFTTHATLDEIAVRHHLSAADLLSLVEKCLMQHEDGTPWGFRALFPGVKVIDHTPQASPGEAVDPDKERSNDAVSSSSGAEREGSTILNDEAVDDDEVIFIGCDACKRWGIGTVENDPVVDFVGEDREVMLERQVPQRALLTFVDHPTGRIGRAVEDEHPRAVIDRFTYPVDTESEAVLGFAQRHCASLSTE